MLWACGWYGFLGLGWIRGVTRVERDEGMRRSGGEELGREGTRVMSGVIRKKHKRATYSPLLTPKQNLDIIKQKEFKKQLRNLAA